MTTTALNEMTREQMTEFVLLSHPEFTKEMMAISELVFDGNAHMISFGQASLLDFLDREVESDLNFHEVIARDNPSVWNYRLDQIYDWIDAQRNCGAEAA